MRLFLLFLFLLPLGITVSEIPSNWQQYIPRELLLKKASKDFSSDYSADLFQGDIAGIDKIVPTKDLENEFNEMGNDAQHRWPNGLVPYTLSQIFSPTEASIIKQAMDIISTATSGCVNFVERTNESDYIDIVRGIGCSSLVGRQSGVQTVSYSRDCLEKLGDIQHELMHALGFFHEMSRGDRDKYIWIGWANLLDTVKKDFEIISDVMNFGLPYDYDSVMHYGWNDFSKNGKPTIVPKVKGKRIGQRVNLSPGDINKLNKIYSCQSVDVSQGTEGNNQLPTENPNGPIGVLPETSTQNAELVAEKNVSRTAGVILDQAPTADEDESSDSAVISVREALKLHPEFMTIPINIDECQVLKTDNCKPLPGSDQCADGAGFFTTCSAEAINAEVEVFLSKFQRLNAGRAVELQLAGKREFTQELFNPGLSFLISIVIKDFPGFQMSDLAKIKIPWLTHIGISNCPNTVIGRDDFKAFPLLTMIIFASSTFETIEKGAFDNLFHLRQLALDNGFKGSASTRLKDHLMSFHCDCKYQWLRDFISRKPYLIAARKLGEIHTWGGIVSHHFTARQNAIPVDCEADELVGPPEQTEFSVNVSC